jgi:ABC-type glycerol-3-phosphate transport system permease component
MTKARRHLSRVMLNLAVAVGGIFFLVPFAWMVSASFKTTQEIFSYPPSLIPNVFSLANYQRLFGNWPFPSWYGNSLIVAILTTVMVLFFSSLAGFAFAKYRFRGQTALFLVLLGSSMIPFPILLIPLFILVANIGWVNSLEALIIPFMAPAIGIFLMRQFMSYVPSELLDAARIDGASDFRTYWQIVLPLVLPGLATLGILTFLGSWNNYLWPLVVLRSSDSMTLPVGMAAMLTGVAAGSAPPYGPAMAASVLVSIPIIVVFLLLQRYYIAGLTLGGVKQ